MMPRSSLLIVFVCVALTLQSVAGFVVSRLVQNRRQNGSDVALGMFGRSSRNNNNNNDSLPKGRAKIVQVNKMEEFLKFLGEDDRLCVVKFHASWCKSCQAFGVKFRKLGLEHADVLDERGELVQSGNVRLASIEFGANTALCRALGIKRLPYIHIYKSPVGRITDFSCGPSKFPMLEEKLATYLSMSVQELKFEKEMDKGAELGDVIVSELQQIHNEQQMGVMASYNASTIQTDSSSSGRAAP